MASRLESLDEGVDVGGRLIRGRAVIVYYLFMVNECIVFDLWGESLLRYAWLLQYLIPGEIQMQSFERFK